MGWTILIHTRNLSIPGGKQTYIKALQPHFKNKVTYFYYGKQALVKESFLAFLKRMTSDYINFYRILKRGDFDLVHINTSLNRNSYLRDSIFTLISRFLGKKTLVYWHGWVWDFEKRYASNLLSYFRLTFGKADGMICLAGEFVEQLKRYGYRKQIFVETTVVEDPILFHAQGPSAQTEKNKKTILFLSRIERTKGIYETIESFKSLIETYPFIELKIAGTGSELNRAKNYVAQNKISGVNFLGWKTGADKIKVLSEADVFVHPSYSEGMPISVLEAMAMGLPVITTNVGGIKDFFKVGSMGYTIRIKDDHDLYKKISALLEDPEMCRQMGSYNKEYSRRHFSARHVCERLESIYENVINNNGTKEKIGLK